MLPRPRGASGLALSSLAERVLIRRYADPEPAAVVGAKEVADTTPPVSNVNAISPYWIESPAIDSVILLPLVVTANVSYDPSGVENVSLYYRYSRDNSWNGVGWKLYGVDSDGSNGWFWWFFFLEGYGYYAFYWIASS